MEMWSQVALHLGMPWRAAEAMHWQLGENDIFYRATGRMPLSTHDSPDNPTVRSSIKPLSCKLEEFAAIYPPKIRLPSLKEAFPDLPDDQWRSQHPMLMEKINYSNCLQRREPNPSFHFDFVK
jgi:hypothetical protein